MRSIVALTIIIFGSIVGAVRAIDVLPLGDSITHGWGSFDNGGYRTYLAQSFPEFNWVGRVPDGPPTARRHEGWNGYTIRQIDLDILNDVAAEYTPDVVLLMIGTNDAWTGTGPNAPEFMIPNLTNLINHAYALWPESKMYVSTIPRIYHAPSGTENPGVVNYNVQLPNLVSSMRAMRRDVHLVDSYSRVPVSELTDGVHPSDLGYRHIADAFEWGILKSSKQIQPGGYIPPIDPRRGVPEPASGAVVIVVIMLVRVRRSRGSENMSPRRCATAI